MNLKSYCCNIIVVGGLTFTALMTSADDAGKKADQIINVPFLEEKVNIDGTIDENVWTKAATYEINEELTETKTSTGKYLPPGYQTSLKVWQSKEALYLGFRCENPDIPMFLNAYPRLRDDTVYSDECIEIFINSGKEPTFQIVFNAQGSVYDGIYKPNISSVWNGKWRVATRIVRGAWYAEVEIPFSDIGDSKTVLINCGRTIHAWDGKIRRAAWKAPGWFKPLLKINRR